MKTKSVLVFLLIILLSLPSFAAGGSLQVEVLEAPSQVEAGQDFTLKFLVKNESEQKIDQLTSQLDIPESALVLDQGSKSSYNYSLEAGEEVLLHFSMKALENIEESARLSLTTSHRHEGTEECPLGDSVEIVNQLAIEVVPVASDDDNNDDDTNDDDDNNDDDTNDDDDNYYDNGYTYYSDDSYDDSPHKNKPKLIISKYVIEPEMPRAGEKFTMTLSFHNTNSEKSCRNIKIFLTNESAGEGEGLASGGVFSPVESSNTFYIDYIAPGETKEKTITFHTIPTAPSKTYTMTANFEYEDYQGTELKATELIGIPVVQISKVQVDDPQISEMGPGGPVMIDLNFYNTGRDDLTNFMVSVEGDGFSADEKRYFVGNFQTGSSDSFSTTIYPLEEGEYKGKIIISYEDSTGSPHSIEKDFEGYYTMMDFSDFEDFPIDETPKSGLLSNPYLIGAVLLVLAAVTGIVFKKKRDKKRLKDLDLNERD